MIDRRKFVLTTACATACTAAGCSGGSADDDDDGATPTPVVNAGIVELPLTDYPELANVGGSASFPIGSAGLLVAQTSAGVYEAWTRRCTHQGCTVAFSGASLDCPCHGSSFDLNGAVVTGPATAPLREFGVTFDGTTVFVDTN